MPSRIGSCAGQRRVKSVLWGLMILNDKQIRELAEKHSMIEPFQQGLVSSTDEGPVISFGLSSFGYDIRLSPQDFRIFRHLPGQVVDPKNFNPNHVEKA